MATTLFPDTFEQWMRRVEDRLSHEERRLQWTDGEIQNFGNSTNYEFGYQFKTATTTPPATGEVRLNTADQTVATVINIADTTWGGNNQTAALTSIPVGTSIYLQDPDDETVYQTYNTTGAPTDHGAWFSIPVAHIDGNFPLTNQTGDDVTYVGYAVLAAGGGGAAGPPGPAGPGVAAGGLIRESLVKSSSTDFATKWALIQAAQSVGATITGAIAVAAGTSYVINLGSGLGNVPITLPSAPEQGTVVAFMRTDANAFTSTARITPGGTDAIADVSPYVLSMRNVVVRFTYVGTVWYADTLSGMSGVFGVTPSSAFNPSVMSRDVNGRTQVEDPVAAKDVVNLEYLQAHGGSGGGSDEVAIRPDDPATPEPTAELWVDTDDTSGGLLGLPQSPTPTTDLNTATAPGFYWASGSAVNTPVATRAYHVWTYTATDTPTNIVQVAYRATAGLLYTHSEQWQRTGSAGSWSPWVPVRYDTGWKTLPIASGYQASGSTPAPAYRIKNDMVYYRGQIGKTDGSAFGATAFTAVNALPAEAQPTIGSGGYVMTALTTSSGSIGGRMYIAYSNLAAILINMEATGALYIDIGTFFYPLN